MPRTFKPADPFRLISETAAVVRHEADVPQPMPKDEVARYIAQLAGELGAMAEGAHLNLLAYFLDMARVEAESIARDEN